MQIDWTIGYRRSNRRAHTSASVLPFSRIGRRRQMRAAMGVVPVPRALSRKSRRNAIVQGITSRCQPQSGSQLTDYLLAMWMVCRWALSYHISIHTPKYALATLIQGVASALRHHLFEQASHCFYPIHQTVQLLHLSLSQRSPTF